MGDDVELYTDNTRTKVQQRFHFRSRRGLGSRTGRPERVFVPVAPTAGFDLDLLLAVLELPEARLLDLLTRHGAPVTPSFGAGGMEFGL